jgi:uncharacterized protein (TIGR02611 family)
VPSQSRFTRAGERHDEGAARNEHGAPRAEGPRAPKDPNPRLERFGERTEDFVDSVESAINRAVPKRVHARRDPRQNTVVNVTWRALVLVVGIAMITLGIVLLVLPGPGWGSILLGLAILATEYTWANRLLQPVRRRVRAEASKVRRLSPRQQLAATTTTVVAGVSGVAFSIWYITQYGWTLPW